jgi:predicted RNA-binding protein with PIN domain
MPYLIDGHNLIPKISGLSLEVVDDELQLVERLQEFCRLRGKQAEVYFDKAPPGQPKKRRFGAVTAYFVRVGQTADDAIRNRLIKLGRGARNWTVVSSDRMIQAAAREVQAETLSAETFAAQLEQALKGSAASENDRSEVRLSAEEVDDWLELFRKKKDLQ